MGERLAGLRARRYVEALVERASLTSLQSRRLHAIVELLNAAGTFLLEDALRAGNFSLNPARAQDAFQDFRKTVNHAAEVAGVNLRLELSSHKTTPDHRRGWLCTAGMTGGELVELASDVDIDKVLGAHARLVEKLFSDLNDRLDGVRGVLESLASEQAVLRGLIEDVARGVAGTRDPES